MLPRKPINMIRIRASKSADKVWMRLDGEASSLNEVIRESIPGAQFYADKQCWSFPSTRRVALHLRAFLTGKTSDLDLDAESRQRLHSLAEEAPKPDVILNDSKERVIISFEFHLRYQDLVQALSASRRTDGTWTLPVSKSDELVDEISRRNLDLVLSDEVKKLTEKKQAALRGYTGSMLSLAHIPLHELQYIATYPMKKNSKTTFATRLNGLGYKSILDVISTPPLRYIDRSTPKQISELKEGDQAVIIGKIASMTAYNQQTKSCKIVIQDGEGKKISMTFFRQFWLTKRHKVGDEVIAYGKYSLWRNSKGQAFPQLSSPRIDSLRSKRGEVQVIPVYPQSEKANVTTWDLQEMNKEILARMGEVSDPVPERLRRKYGLPTRQEALNNLHFPRTPEEAERARQRLTYEEFLELQLFIQRSKSNYESMQGVSHTGELPPLADSYIESLSYVPTNAQSNAISTINAEMAESKPMHRLLQGDVGSGKTTVAIAALLKAIESKHQSAFMAPTEILAEQLHNGLKEAIETLNVRWADELSRPLRVEFLASKTTAKNKRLIKEGLATGAVDIVVGTNALLSEDVTFASLSLVVIDEQHRFGTEQRSRLRRARQDGRTPDMLVMTATPIPRTSATVLYGDMDITVLDELPAGRIPINTVWINQPGQLAVSDYTSPAWSKVHEQVKAGRQAYVVASLVEDNDKLAAQSTIDALNALQNGVLSDLRLGMVHGQMPRKEREEVMSEFAAGNIDVLVATTVIEVGVNVPNATVMVVLDAGRFGISQLHQIRGRVGRATWESTCYLISDTQTAEGQQRLEALERSTDGFYLSEVDLELRGEGTLFSAAQSGASDLRIASLKDIDILTYAQADAQEIIREAADLSNYPELAAEVDHFFGERSIDA